MSMMCVQFFVQEGMRHAGHPIHEWLFAEARVLGIPGGTVFRSSAGYGRHGLIEDRFFELAGELPETVVFFAEPEQVENLAQRVGEAGLRLVYVRYPVELGVTGDYSNRSSSSSGE